MLNTIKQLLGLAPKTNYRELIKRGAQIIDVRTNAEYRTGCIKGSLNLPLQSLNANLSKVKKDRPVITCCASGMRSASAKSILKSNGFNEVYNGGSWISLQQKI